MSSNKIGPCDIHLNKKYANIKVTLNLPIYIACLKSGLQVALTIFFFLSITMHIEVVLKSHEFP